MEFLQHAKSLDQNFQLLAELFNLGQTYQRPGAYETAAVPQAVTVYGQGSLVLQIQAIADTSLIRAYIIKKEESQGEIFKEQSMCFVNDS